MRLAGRPLPMKSPPADGAREDATYPRRSSPICRCGLYVVPPTVLPAASHDQALVPSIVRRIEFPNVDLPASQQKHELALRHVAALCAAGFWLFALVAPLVALAALACLSAVLWQETRPRANGRG
jgi:hypothetical protein